MFLLGALLGLKKLLSFKDWNLSDSLLPISPGALFILFFCHSLHWIFLLLTNCLDPSGSMTFLKYAVFSTALDHFFSVILS
jgi:hypothetical protein